MRFYSTGWSHSWCYTDDPAQGCRSRLKDDLWSRARPVDQSPSLALSSACFGDAGGSCERILLLHDNRDTSYTCYVTRTQRAAAAQKNLYAAPLRARTTARACLALAFFSCFITLAFTTFPTATVLVEPPTSAA